MFSDRHGSVAQHCVIGLLSLSNFITDYWHSWLHFACVELHTAVFFCVFSYHSAVFTFASVQHIKRWQCSVYWTCVRWACCAMIVHASSVHSKVNIATKWFLMGWSTKSTNVMPPVLALYTRTMFVGCSVWIHRWWSNCGPELICLVRHWWRWEGTTIGTSSDHIVFGETITPDRECPLM